MRAFRGVLALSLLAACTGSEAASGPPTIQATTNLVYGADTGAVTFGEVRSIAVDHWGRLYALDPQDFTVRVFDSTGHLVRSLGRRGQGPGELQTPEGLAFGPDGNTSVYDAQAKRLTVYDTAGEFVTTYPLATLGYGYFWEGGIDSAGRVLDQQFTYPSDTGTRPIVLRMDLRTGVTDTLEYPRCNLIPLQVFAVPHGVMDVPFAAEGVNWIDPRGSIWCANTDRAVAYRTPFGSMAPVDSFISVAVPAPVTADERASVIEEIDEFGRQHGGVSLDHGRIPELKPVLNGLDRDAEGRLWMRIIDSAGPALHVFRPDGTWIARVRLDQDLTLSRHLAFHGDHVYAAGYDSLGAPVVYRFHVTLP